MGTVSTMEQAPTVPASDRPVAGSAMDRQVPRKRLTPRRLLLVSIPPALALVAWLLLASPGGRSLTVADDRLILSPVSSGLFEDSIAVRARVAPLKTVYLDAVQGGRVEEVLVEDGASLQPGQAVIRLSNPDLQLSVMNTESRVMEQLNSMRDQELRLEQNRLSHKRTLVDVDYQMRRLQREIKRRQELLTKGHASQSNYDDLVDELDYNTARRKVTLESQASDERLMVKQLAFFEENTAVMENNLEFARQSLEELNVRAPVAGKLSGFDLQVGQNVDRGVRIGQIDDANQFKLVAEIDEFYLARVDIDQLVTFQHKNRDYRLRVAKVYPNVERGQFEVDMQFTAEAPAELRRGQTIQAKLTLGDSSEALLIPNGSFYQDTGGQWIFVVSPDGEEAVKRKVKLGRRNARYIEVLEGLDQNERVITSPYSGFRDMDRLVLNKTNTH